ncbi:class I adenylate-forming enzyme family protein [Paenibacillus sp. HB172176]|uniref:class I adenylate-forming enzyme family protein n=1 Tax=Paenibacillus sp. HB172176 TaxID=2493690 RepID=UPI001438BED7|nr:class I adenylate-forming enzyme family protein [Paenibacillus sp. HB172176]
MSEMQGLQPNTVAYLLQQRAILYGDDIAYLYPEWGQSYSWSKIWDEVKQLAGGLLKQGVSKGDRVAFLMTGRIELILSMYAAACIGAVSVPLNTYCRKDELIAYLKESSPSLLLISREGHRQHYPSMLREIVDDLSRQEETDWLPQRIFVQGESKSEMFGFRDYREWLIYGGKEGSEEKERLLQQACQAVQADDPLVLLFTSGTLGMPKGVLRTMASFHGKTSPDAGGDRSVRSGWLRTASLKVMQRFRILNLLPLYHMGGFGMILGNLSGYNVKTIMMSRFHPVEALAIAEEQRCHVLLGTPYMLQGMMVAPERARYSLKSVLGVVFTSASVSPSILRKIKSAINLRFFIVSYGSSEAGAVASGTCIMNKRIDWLLALLYKLLKHTKLLGGLIPFEKFMAEENSLAGILDKEVEVKVVEPDSGKPLPKGIPGEIIIRSHRVMKYTRLIPVETDGTAQSEPGWHRSGDLGYLNEDNHLVIAGRLHRLISRGGEKISPLEIENAILRNVEVEDAFVLGIPDELYGEQICACVVAKSGSTLTEERLKHELARQLSSFKLPKEIIFLKQLPLSPTGKISFAEMENIANSMLRELRRNA